MNIKSINKNNSILILFTWRETKNKKLINYNRSRYFKNIFKLILNVELTKYLIRNNITLYFGLHHKINSYYREQFINLKYIKFVEQNNIVNCIKISDLFITDFSSIIFDFVYQRKPYIIYIPDYNDTLINKNYKNDYVELIQSMENGNIEFENKYFDVDLVVKKIIFYIQNNFQLEEKLKIFYNN